MARTKNTNVQRRRKERVEDMAEENNEPMEREQTEAEASCECGEERKEASEGEDGEREETYEEEDGGEEEAADDIPMQPKGLFFSANEFAKPLKMQTRCDPKKVVDVLRSRLSPNELRWFMEHDQFKHVFHMNLHRTRKVMGLWMLLVHTAKVDKRKEAWFVVNGVLIRYSIREHALLSGLCCHMYPKKYPKIGSLNFVNKYFDAGKHKAPKIEVKHVLEALEKMKTSAGKDRLKMAVLYFLSMIMRGRKKMHGGNIEEFVLRIVDDLETCKTFPWGRYTFDDCMSTIGNMMDHMDGKVRETTTFPGFILPLEILAFESVLALRTKFRESIGDADGECPRMCKGKFKDSASTGFGLDQIYDALGSTKEISSILAAEGEEKELVGNAWWRREKRRWMSVTPSLMVGQPLSLRRVYFGRICTRQT